jgi:AraC-like DNA-binding protein
VADRGRLWTAYHETYVFCCAHLQTTDQAWRYRGRRYGATTATTMLIEPGEVHRTLRGGRAAFHLLFVEARTVEDLLDVRRLHFREGQTAQAVVRSTFLQMCQTVESDGSKGLAAEESALAFLHAASRTCGDGPRLTAGHPRCPDALRRTREFLREHYDETVRLDDLAAVAQLSKYHLSRMFKREVGVPLHQYQTLVRLEKGRQLLLDGASISNVAAQVGFFDQPHFHRAFVRAYGMTPAHFCRGQ